LRIGKGTARRLSNASLAEVAYLLQQRVAQHHSGRDLRVLGEHRFPVVRLAVENAFGLCVVIQPVNEIDDKMSLQLQSSRVPTGPLKSWNYSFDFSGPEKSWKSL